jgi:hypothetical protein
VKEAATEAIKNKIETYRNWNYKTFHDLGKDAVEVASTIAGFGNIGKLKNVKEGIEETGERIKSQTVKVSKKLNLGKFLNKIADYEVYENGEVFYRGMTHENYKSLVSTGKLPATSETFTSPTLEYVKAVGYGSKGVIVKFQMQRGTLDKLKSIGVRNDDSKKMMQYFSDMQEVKEITKWTKNNALFKTEGSEYGMLQINIGLGRGKAINEFNENIINFEIVE